MRERDMERRETYIELAENLTRLEVAITRGFTESTAAHEGTRKELEFMAKQHERFAHALYGNGKEGLVTTVAKLRNQVNWAMGIATTLFLFYITKTFEWIPHMFK